MSRRRSRRCKGLSRAAARLTGRGRRIAFSFATDVRREKSAAPQGQPDLAGRKREAGPRRPRRSRPDARFRGRGQGGGQGRARPWTAQGPALVWLDGALAEDAFPARLGEGRSRTRFRAACVYETAQRQARARSSKRRPCRGRGRTYFVALALAAKDGGAPVDLRASVESLDWRGMDWSQAQLDLGAGRAGAALGDGSRRRQGRNFRRRRTRDGWRGRARLKASDFTAFAAALREAAPAASRALCRRERACVRTSPAISQRRPENGR